MNYNEIKKELDRLSMKYQKGGTINDRGRENFNRMVKQEKEYLQGKKIRERLEKMGLDPNVEIPKLKEKLNGVSFAYGETANGAHYSPDDNQIVATSESTAVSPYTMSHEVGHIFNDVNEPNNDFVSDRNAFAEQSFIGRAVQNLRRRYNYDWYTKEGHETSPEELVADVHALRQELLPTGYDGRFSNFTNEAYNSMLKIASENSQSASARMLNKVGRPQLKYYYNTLNKTMNEMTPEDEDFLKRFEKDKKKHEAVQKKYIFDIMNKVVYNDKPSNAIDFAKLGGLIKILNNGKV